MSEANEKPGITAEHLQELHAKIDAVAGAVDSVPALHSQLASIEAEIARIWEKVTEVAGKVARYAAPALEAAALLPGAVGAVARTIERVALPIIDAVCPEHPEAPVTVNGCTAPGCTYAPPAQGQTAQLE